jgi:putative FmdB family regulatory protein
MLYFFSGIFLLYYWGTKRTAEIWRTAMPIYEYECGKCKERFEVLRKVDEDDAGLCCPKCKAEKPARLLSAFCSGTSKGLSGPAPVSGHAHAAPGHR